MSIAFVIIIVLVVGLAAGSIVLTLFAGWIVFALFRGLARLLLPDRRTPAPVIASRAPAAPPRPDLAWQRTRQRFAHLRTEYAAYECDPLQVLRLPALADVSVPSTARFVDAFAEAQALETDTYPGADHAARFDTAVDRAGRAWTAARDAAGRIRLTGLAPAERGTVERVIKLLTTARDSDSEPERQAAYNRARTELGKLDRAGVLHVPLPAQAALDAGARGQLPRSDP